MSIRLATVRPAKPGLEALLKRRRVPLVAANDNGEPLRHDAVLRDALKLFAKHGLGAAEIAKIRAESAWMAGEDESYRRWLAICRTLDRRLAARIIVRVANGRV